MILSSTQGTVYFRTLLYCLTLFATLIANSQPAAQVTRVTNVIDSYPMLSPDGKTLCFQSNRTGDWEIYTMRIDGSELRQLTHSAGFDGGPVWSPDGSKIVFPSERDNDPEIYLMNADGSDQVRLTNTPGDDSHPHWFPDGKRIIFNSARSTPDLKADWGRQWHELYSMKVDGSDVKQLTTFHTVSTYPSVSPDGKMVCFRQVVDGPALNWDLTVNKNNRNSEVFVMEMDGSHLRNLSMSPAFDGWPSWSPDSRKIVFVSNRGGLANTGQLYVADIAEGSLRLAVAYSGSLAQPSWSADGRNIYAYQGTEIGEIEFGSIVKVSL